MLYCSQSLTLHYIKALQTIYKHYKYLENYGNDAELVHAATGNARSPTVDSRVDGTSNAEVNDDRRHCRPGILVTS